MSLIAHWPLEGNPQDEAFGNYNGTEIGGVSYGDGILGDCYDNTSGSGTGIQLMEHADAQNFENVFSWSLWFKSTTTSGGTVRRILARDDSEYPTFTIDQNQSGQQDLESDAAGNAQVNEWHHAAFVHQSDQTVITYIDGVRQGTRSAPKAGTARPWVIGGNTEGDGDISGGHFVGKIDDVRFYDHVLSKAEVKELSQGKVSHWNFGDFGEIETFDEQRSGLGWDVTNAYIQNTSKIGNYSIGSFGNGETRMAWEPKGLEGGKQIQSFSYWWQEDSSQTGHAVRLFDSSGNEVQESGTENPQWYLNDGSGRYQEYGGDNYNVWTLFSFEFNWSAGTYDFYLRDSQSGTTRTGTNNLQNATNVERIEFNGDGYGSANYNRFDGISFAYQNAKDSTVQKNNANVVGDLQIRSGKVGEHSASFDGVDDSINFSQNNFDNLTEAITCSLWAKRTGGSGTQTIFLVGRDVTAGVEFRDDSMTIHTNSSEYDTNFSRINQDQWVHLTVSYESGSGGAFYKDGNQIGSIPDGGDVIYPEFYGSSPSIGSHGGIYHFKGDIDDVRVYASALSQSQIQSIYQAKARLTDNHRFFNQSIQESGHRGRFTDYTVWDIGTNGSQGDFSRNGGTSENEIIRGTGPHGKFSALWKCIPDSNSNADGGWNHNFQGDNSTRLRMSTFFRRNNSKNGVTYHGCDNSGNTLNLDGSTNGNPYFWNGDPPNLDEWYLAVGILHPNSYQGGQTGISGVYDMDGNQVRGGTDYKWGTGSRQELRNYLYYSTNTSERQYFAYPRVEVVDGTEPSIEALLEGVDAKSEDYTQKLQNAKDPVGMSIQSNRTVISSMNEVGPAANSLIGWWKLNGNLKDSAGKNDGRNNGASIVDGYGQTAYDFNGSSNYIDISSSKWNNYFGDSTENNFWTSSAWVNIDNLNQGYQDSTAGAIIGQRYGTTVVPLGIRENGSIFVNLDDSRGSSPESNDTISENSWFHIVATYKWNDDLSSTPYGESFFYINGQPAGSDTNDSDSASSSSSSLYIGRDNRYDMYVNGKIQDVRIYDKVLTDEEVNVLYEMSTPDAKMKKRPRALHAPQFSETQL